MEIVRDEPGAEQRVHHVPKQVQEPKYLHDEPDERPFEEYEQDASKETQRPSNFLFPGEEVERLLRTNDKCNTTQE